MLILQKRQILCKFWVFFNFCFRKNFVLISTNMVYCTYLNFECICSKSKAFLELKKKYFELLSFSVWILSEFHKKFKIKTPLSVHAHCAMRIQSCYSFFFLEYPAGVSLFENINVLSLRKVCRMFWLIWSPKSRWIQTTFL